MPTFYDLMKYAATGIASPDMTAFDKSRALAAFGGGAVQTLTDVPPLSFKANGKPLISWSMLGAGSQTGTPTPDAPIMPTFCGVRTAQLFDIESWLISNGAVFSKDGNSYTFNSMQPMYSTPFYFSDTDIPVSISGIMTDITSTNARIDLLRANGTTAKTDAVSTTKTKTENIVCAGLRFNWTTGGTMKIDSLMLNLGTTALPYEPFGWSEKITNAGQTSTVYLGQTQTVRRVKKLVLDGTEDYVTGGGNAPFVLRLTDIIQQQDRNVVLFMCTHYQAVPNSASWAQYSSIVSWSFSGSTNTLALVFRDTSCADLNAFKDYLSQQYTAGTPVCVWYVLAEPTTGIINEPLCKIGDYADELHSADAGVSIPTTKGQNTLTVGTDLQPSEMTITYKS